MFFFHNLDTFLLTMLLGTEV